MTAVKLNIEEVESAFSSLVKKQVPFAIAKALTMTAKNAQFELSRQVEKKLDRPTPFTKKAFGIKAASKRKPVATVFVKDKQAAYLGYQIEGGTRKPDGKAVLVPANIKLNKYGNIPSLRGGKKVAALLAKPNTFQATIKGIPGIWQRYGRKGSKVKLLIRFESEVNYRTRLPFDKIVKGVARSKISRNFNTALAQAIASSR